MENIESLLAELNSSTYENNVSELEETASEEPSNSITSLLPDSDEFKAAKKDISSEYSASGNEIYKNLKEREEQGAQYTSNNGSTQNSWTKSKPLSSDKSIKFGTPKSTVKEKLDVYTDPVFGLRIVNPLITTQFMQSKMVDKLSVKLHDIAFHLQKGNKSMDWVFGGIVVFKSGMKTSQKGKQYCFWRISDLRSDMKEITLYLFSNACTDLMKVAVGTAVAVLNATPFQEENVTKKDITLTARNADQVLVLGGSKDYGVCKAIKKNGDKCTAYVNKNNCDVCPYHMRSEYNKYSSNRGDLKPTSYTPNGLRNKILGKSEVFYGGKSYTAIKVASKNSKVQQRDNKYLEMLKNSTSNQNSKLAQSDREKITAMLEMQNNTSATEVDDGAPKNTQKVALGVNENKTSKVISSRLQLMQEAGKKLLETGEITRVGMSNTNDKKRSDLCFASVFKTENADSHFLDEVKRKFDSKTKSKVEDEIVVELPTSSKLRNFIRTNKSTATANVTNFQNVFKKSFSNVSSSSDKTKKGDANSEVNTSTDSSNVANGSSNNNGNVRKSTFVSKMMENSNDDSVVTSLSKFPAKGVDSLNPQECNNVRLPLPILQQQSRSIAISANIHERKKNLAKMKAINLIKQSGGITKSDPNQIKLSEERKQAVKRKLEKEEKDIECKDESKSEKPVLSQRFLDLMKATSKHENLVTLAEDIEQFNYFNKMEKKEYLEEKMLNTFKVPCKAVMCLKCKYKWFSASDICRSQGHPIKVVDAVKRFFKCLNCSNRTVSLEIMPLINCHNCGDNRWTRTGMIKEKIVGADNALCIRGDEQKFLDSMTGKYGSLNLLVPE